MSFSYTYNYDHNQNPNSTTAQEEEEEFPPFSLFSFPSPFLDENSLFLGHKATDQTQQPNMGLGLILNKPLLENIPTQQQDSTRRRYSTRKNGKKDRHSKIHTSQGFRDRRMRLSLEIARKFFDLQDRLGFDKASKTIDWLFSKSEKAIRKLGCSSQQITNNAANLMSSERAEKSQDKIKRMITEEGEYSCVVSAGKISEKSITKITKEFRAKARARARERTRENMLMRCLEKLKDENLSAQPYKLAQLGPEGNPYSLFEIGQESTSNSSSTRDEHISTNSRSVLHRPLANVEIVENLMSSTTTSSSGSAASCYGYQQNGELFSGGGLYSYSNNVSFLGNWDIDQFQILLKHGPDLDSKNS